VDQNIAETEKENINPETLQKLMKAKAAIHSSFGQVVLAMSSVPRYRSQSLADLAHLVIDPLIRDRIAIAQVKAEEGAEKASLVPASIAIWASVSPEVDAKIREQIKAGALPVRLKAEDWNSGDIVWLLDVIAPTQKMATAVLANFNKIAKQESIHIHPLVSRLVDPEVLKRLALKAAPAEVPETGTPKTLN
jgi:cytolysin-activating lysine-acyltransferase